MKLFAIILLVGSTVSADIIVATDGSGQFTSVQQAVDSVPHELRRTVIRIKPGKYKERIVVPFDKDWVSFVGEDAEKTILTFDSKASDRGADGKAIGTFGTPSVTIEADDFVAENITFENSAGPVGQALAISILGDRAVFRNCRFLGWQDTLLSQTGRHYFEDCYIAGHVDFIFGGATAWFEKCRIHCLRTGYITAASTPHDQGFGFVFNNCTITAESPEVRILLGRPWRADASTIFLDCEMPANVSPTAWSNWNRPEREKTARYAEFSSKGPGANPTTRAAWTRQIPDSEARKITLDRVFDGWDRWHPIGGRRHLLTPDVPSAIPDAAELGGHRVAADGKFLSYSRSTDQVNWSAPRQIDVMKDLNALDISSPQIFRDESSGGFIIFWASTIAQNFFQSYQEPVENNPRLWYTTTRDFETFAPAKLLFDTGYPVRRAAILKAARRYALLHEDGRTRMRRIRVAFGDSPTGPWGPSFTPSAQKGVGATPESEMSSAATALRDSLTPEQKAVLTFAFTDDERLNWAFVPRARKGIPWKQMSPQQRELGTKLLKSGLSQRGYEKADAIMNQIELVLRDLENNAARRDPELYYFTLFGDPSAADKPWGWRVEGHHLSLNFTILDGKGVAGSPAFFGAHPANVQAGPHKGLRVLGAEEDLGRKLVKSLDPEQSKLAIIAETAPRDILSGNSRKLDPMKPAGIPAAQLNESQRKLLLEVIGEYAQRLRRELAEQDVKKITDAGIEKVHFAWAGETDVGVGHYYRIQGPTFMIEYDNTQSNANHVHSVWRDPENDFGEDLLKKHYQNAQHDQN